MTHLFRTKLFVLVCLGMLAVASADALASSGSQNPDVTVTVTANSKDTVTVTTGDAVTIAETVANNTASAQLFTVTQTLEKPNGTYSSVSRIVRLGPHQTS